LKKILIIQPYIPRYRLEFFTLLAQVLNERNLKLVVLAPEPDENLASRRDTAAGLPFAQNIRVFRMNLFGRRLDYYCLPKGTKFRDFDLIIMEQTLKNIQFAILALRLSKIFRFGTRTQLALWGHGLTVVKKKNKIEHWIQLVLSKQSAFFFAYTEGGLRYLVGNGYPRTRIIALGNSNSSRARLNRIKDFESLSGASEIQSSNDCCFIGALEDSKGIQLLIEALPIIKAAVPTFTFTFFGDGPLRDVIGNSASTLSYVSSLGYIEQSEFDRKVVGYSLILNPGRVGLVAVDSLMLKLPIVTLSDGLHAPEFEYIRDNGCSLSVQGDASTYAQEVISLLESPAKLHEMRQSCESARERYTVESMVENFVFGIIRAIE
jgi:glycosyltransferase involved in cell wall biosynthesis